MKLYACFSRSEGPVAWAIASASARGFPLWPFGRNLHEVPSHAFFRFVNEEKDVIFEAREFNKDGWHGPLPYQKTLDWASNHPKRWVRAYDITDLLQVPVDEIWRRCWSRLGIWRYSHGQIVRIWLSLRLNFPVGDDPSRVVCSEALVRILNGVSRQSEAPAMPKGWIELPPDRASPLDVEKAVKALLKGKVVA